VFLADETSEVVDPSVDSSTEHMENTPECSVNTSAENSQTTAPLTESEGGGEEIQSAQPVSKGESKNLALVSTKHENLFLKELIFHASCRHVTVKGKENQRSCCRSFGGPQHPI
jgi:hypothetical protein